MIIEKLNSINRGTAILIERLKDQYDNAYESAIDDFISDLAKFENREVYSKRNRSKEQIDKEIALLNDTSRS